MTRTPATVRYIENGQDSKKHFTVTMEMDYHAQWWKRIENHNTPDDESLKTRLANISS